MRTFNRGNEFQEVDLRRRERKTTLVLVIVVEETIKRPLFRFFPDEPFIHKQFLNVNYSFTI